MSGLRSRIQAVARVALARRRSRLYGSYADHASALRDCQSGGYLNEKIPQVVAEKTLRFARDLDAEPAGRIVDDVRLVMFAALQAALSSTGGVLSVVDYGGACGAHYYMARKLLGGCRALKWCVFETDAMAAVGAALINCSELEFFTGLTEAGGSGGTPNLAYSNNAVQYSADPIGILAGLLRTGASTICISKLALGQTGSVLFTRQESLLSENGPGEAWPGFRDARISYPLAILPRDEVLRQLLAGGGTLLHYVHRDPLFHPDCGLVEYHSFLIQHLAAART